MGKQTALVLTWCFLYNISHTGKGKNTPLAGEQVY
jgi:hypothetical protein